MLHRAAHNRMAVLDTRFAYAFPRPADPGPACGAPRRACWLLGYSLDRFCLLGTGSQGKVDCQFYKGKYTGLRHKLATASAKQRPGNISRLTNNPFRLWEPNRPPHHFTDENTMVSGINVREGEVVSGFSMFLRGISGRFVSPKVLPRYRSMQGPFCMPLFSSPGNCAGSFK
jgi:hypothetical protein